MYLLSFVYLVSRERCVDVGISCSCFFFFFFSLGLHMYTRLHLSLAAGYVDRLRISVWLYIYTR
jgi:hypothetical protein